MLYISVGSTFLEVRRCTPFDLFASQLVGGKEHNQYRTTHTFAMELDRESALKWLQDVRATGAKLSQAGLT